MDAVERDRDPVVGQRGEGRGDALRRHGVDQLAEGQVVVQSVQRRAADLRQELSEHRVAGDIAPQHEHVGEEADQQ